MSCLAVLALMFAAAISGEFRQWVSEPADQAPVAAVGEMPPADLAKFVADEGDRIPLADVTMGARMDSGTVWLAAQGGIMRRGAGETRWRLFHSQRWLPLGEVTRLAAIGDDSAIVETAAGRQQLKQISWTLDKKIAMVERELRRRHVRDGFICEIELAEPEKLDDGWTQPSNDNDGLWTSMYVAAESFRFATTGEPAARRHAAESLDALLRLGEVTGIPGLVARSIVPGTEADPAARYGGEWHKSQDGQTWWKGDTSSDELVGHFFAYSVYFDLVADEGERQKIAEAASRIASYILDHGLLYIDVDGAATTWGVWNPESLNHDLRRVGDRGLNSLEILSFLRTAEHVSGQHRFRDAAQELIDRHAYATNTVFQKMIWPPAAVNHSDDELAFLSYYPLLKYERDPALREKFLASLRYAWSVERAERSPLFNAIYAAGLQASEHADPFTRPAAAGVEPGAFDRDACLAWFRDVPVDTIYWNVRNSDRRDIRLGPPDDEGRARSADVLPVSERRTMKWNGDPYVLDGGADGRVRDDGTFILLPYWLGMYHRLLE